MDFSCLVVRHCLVSRRYQALACRVAQRFSSLVFRYERCPTRTGCDLLHNYLSRLRYLLYYPIHLANATHTTYILLLAYRISAVYPTRLTNLTIVM